MNEEQFRARLRGAIGEPPPTDLRRGLEARLTAGSARPRSSVLGPLAATLALLTIAGAVGWRLVYQRTSAPATVKHSTATAAPTVAPTAVTVDPLNCRLPVVIMRESGPPGQMTTEPGFVDTRSGQYVKDNSASIAGLPESSAVVLVGPPLFCKPAGSSFGSSGEATVPVWSVAAVKPVLPSICPIRL